MYKMTEVAELTGLSINTIRKWDKNQPSMDKAVKVLRAIGYKAPADPMAYLHSRYISLNAQQKQFFWQVSGIGRTTYTNWKNGTNPTYLNYMTAVQTMDKIQNTESWATKVLNDEYRY